MKLPEPGILLSGAVHAGALVLLLATFSAAPPLPENHEAVPIETISNTDFQQVMRGDKSVKEIVENAPPPADKVAPATESKATTRPVADKDLSAPPPPAPPDPVKDDAPPTPEVAQTPPEPPPAPTPPPTPPAPPPPVPEPPPRPVTAETPPPPPVPLPPVPLPPVQPPPVPMPPPRTVADAETIAPTPPPKPQPPKPDPPKPLPPQPPRVAEPKPVPMPPTPPPPKVAEPKPIEPKPAPRPPAKPRPEKPKPDQLARLLDAQPDQRPLHKAVTHPRPAEEQPNTQRFDPTDISNLLKGPASQTPSTGAKVSKTRVAGSETGAAQKMAASLWDQLDGLLEDQYKQCWSYLGLDGQSKYVPQIKVLYREDGGLAGEPVLINPPADPSMRSLADSALRAVRRCNPLRIPAQFTPYYDQWKGRVLRFDPVDMAG